MLRNLGRFSASATQLFDHQIDEAPDTGFQQAFARIDRHDLYVASVEGGEYLLQATGSQVLCDQEVRKQANAEPGDSGIADGLAAI